MNLFIDRIVDLKEQINEVQSFMNPLELKKSQLERDLKNEVALAEEDALKDPRNAAFKALCEANGAEDVFVDIENGDFTKEIVEDDGTLHITQGKIRGCFISNQELKKSEWNKEARAVCKAMGVKFSELNK